MREIHSPSDILSPLLAVASILNPERALGLAPKGLVTITQVATADSNHIFMNKGFIVIAPHLPTFSLEDLALGKCPPKFTN